jgi:CheY-like chemotaxis protein
MNRNKSTTVLLVDDDANIRLIAEISLAEVGNWRVILAESGAEALKLLLTEKPDFICLDVIMPGMDGPTLFNRIQENVAWRHIPIIFMTAKIQKDEVAQYIRLGAAGVISKPFDPMELPDVIEDILRQPRVAC